MSSSARQCTLPRFFGFVHQVFRTSAYGPKKVSLWPNQFLWNSRWRDLSKKFDYLFFWGMWVVWGHNDNFTDDFCIVTWFCETWYAELSEAESCWAGRQLNFFVVLGARLNQERRILFQFLTPRILVLRILISYPHTETLTRWEERVAFISLPFQNKNGVIPTNRTNIEE